MTKVDDVIGWAQSELGKPYVYGDEGPNTFDCSGLMQFIFAKIGVVLPRTAHEQQAYATPVASPAPGDLVFYGSPAHHVGLYLGAGKMIDAPDVGQNVRVEAVGTPTSYGRVAGVGAGLAPAIGVVTGAASTVTGWLGGARTIVIEGAFVVLGLVLLGYGGYRIVSPGLIRNVRGLL